MPLKDHISYSDRLQGLKPSYDLLIVGGGIYGAALLREAALQGYSAVLVERGDFGGATSANSLKIIHGGIRYLQQFDLKRLRESVREQKILMRIAPHLVHPLPCLAPATKDLRTSRTAYRAAFKLYDWLSLGRNHQVSEEKRLAPGNTVSARECLQIAPFLKEKEVTGGACWWDALVHNSERLVLSFILSACQRGAAAFNYLEVRELLRQGNTVKGAMVRDVLGRQEKQIQIRAKLVIDSAGPWSAQLRQEIAGEKEAGFAKAVNLLLPGRVAGRAVGVQKPPTESSPEQRLLFFVPWRDCTMVGTWYFPAANGREDVLRPEELHCCRQDLRHVLPGAVQDQEDFRLAHVGYVPLRGEKNALALVATHYKIHDHARAGGPEGLVSVQGVKYTTARDVAAKTMRVVARKLGNRGNGASSAWDRLAGGEIENFSSFVKELGQLAPQSMPVSQIERLAMNYGTFCRRIFHNIAQEPALAEPVPQTETLKAEVDYVLAHESVWTLADLVLRRTDLGSHKQPDGEAIQYCASVMARRYGWPAEKQEAEIEALAAHYRKRAAQMESEEGR